MQHLFGRSLHLYSGPCNICLVVKCTYTQDHATFVWSFATPILRTMQHCLVVKCTYTQDHATFVWSFATPILRTMQHLFSRYMHLYLGPCNIFLVVRYTYTQDHATFV